MSKKESKKQDKKKLLILVLFLFAVVGLAGYGAYSYFWTQGSFSGKSDDVQVASFDPQVEYNGDFLGDGGTVTLQCPESTTGSGTVTCTGTLSVYNNGGTDITIAVNDGATASVSPINHDSATATAGTPEFNIDDNNLSSGEYGYVEISVPVTINSDFGSNEEVYRDSAYTNSDNYSYPDAIEVTVNFSLTAAQVH